MITGSLADTLRICWTEQMVSRRALWLYHPAVYDTHPGMLTPPYQEGPFIKTHCCTLSVLFVTQIPRSITASLIDLCSTKKDQESKEATVTQPCCPSKGVHGEHLHREGLRTQSPTSAAAGLHKPDFYREHVLQTQVRMYVCMYVCVPDQDVGFPWWSSDWESACRCRGYRSDPWPRRILHPERQLSLPHLRARALPQGKPPEEKPTHSS